MPFDMGGQGTDRKILISAAVEAELGALRAALEAAPAPGLRLRAIGVGPVEAALGAYRALFEAPPAQAIFVGSCGAFPASGLSIGDAVVVRRSCLTASDAAAGHSYIPAPAAHPVEGDEALAVSVSRAAGIPMVSAATVVAITRSEAHARLLEKETGAQVEHLEAYAFLRAAEQAGIPAVCVLGVSNRVGPTAHEEWKAHADRAAAAATQALLSWLRA